MSGLESWPLKPLARENILMRVKETSRLSVCSTGVPVYYINKDEFIFKFTIPQKMGTNVDSGPQPYLVKIVTEMTEGGKGWVVDDSPQNTRSSENTRLTFPQLLEKYNKSYCDYFVSSLIFGECGSEQHFVFSAAVSVPVLRHSFMVNIMVREEERDCLLADLWRGW